MGKALSKSFTMKTKVGKRKRDSTLDSPDYLLMGPPLVVSQPNYVNLDSVTDGDVKRLPTDDLPDPPRDLKTPSENAPIPQAEGKKLDEEQEDEADGITVAVFEPQDDSGFEDAPCSDALHALVVNSLPFFTEEDNGMSTHASDETLDSPPRAHLISSNGDLNYEVPSTVSDRFDSEDEYYQSVDEFSGSTCGSLQHESGSHGSREQSGRRTKTPTVVKKVYNNCTFINFKKSSGVQVGTRGSMHYAQPSNTPSNTEGLIELVTLLARQLGLSIGQQPVEYSFEEDTQSSVEFEVIEDQRDNDFININGCHGEVDLQTRL